MRNRVWQSSLLVWIFFLGSFSGYAQIDPEERQLIQLGYNQPLEGKSPIAGYAYYHLNQPKFLRHNLTLRLVVAPVYVDAELGISEVLGPFTALGIGVAGGGFADSYSEVRDGKYLRGESFTGHGGEGSVSIYHLFNPQRDIPLHGVLRGSVHSSFYQRDSQTLPAFVLPEDQTSFNVRAGLRWGGREPLMRPKLGMELSAWYEGQFRSDPGSYGLGGDRRVESDSHALWANALLVYTLPDSQHNFGINLTGGTTLNPDRFSAYRLGALLPLVAEFPLNLPGYYFEELSAENFVLLGGYYSLPLDTKNRWNLTVVATSAWVDYLGGLEQPGEWHTGVGGGLTYKSRSEAWHLMLGYSYGIDAIRSSGRGAHSISLLCQFDLAALKRPMMLDPSIPPRSRGLFQIFR